MFWIHNNFGAFKLAYRRLGMDRSDEDVICELSPVSGFCQVVHLGGTVDGTPAQKS